MKLLETDCSQSKPHCMAPTNLRSPLYKNIMISLLMKVSTATLYCESLRTESDYWSVPTESLIFKIFWNVNHDSLESLSSYELQWVSSSDFSCLSYSGPRWRGPKTVVMSNLHQQVRMAEPAMCFTTMVSAGTLRRHHPENLLERWWMESVQ